MEIELPIAMPTIVKTVLQDNEGRHYIVKKLRQESFHVKEERERLIAVKKDPTRIYGFAFKRDLIFFMKINSDTIVNPHKFYLDTLFSELHLITSSAREFITNRASKGQMTINEPEKYIR